MSKHTFGLTVDILRAEIAYQRHAAQEWELRAMSPEFAEISAKLQAVASEHYAQMHDMQMALTMVRFPETPLTVSLSRVSEDGETVTESEENADDNASENGDNATLETDNATVVNFGTEEMPNVITVTAEAPAVETTEKPTRNRRRNTKKELVSA